MESGTYPTFGGGVPTRAMLASIFVERLLHLQDEERLGMKTYTVDRLVEGSVYFGLKAATLRELADILDRAKP